MGIPLYLYDSWNKEGTHKKKISNLLFSGCIDTERIFKISILNGFTCIDHLFGSLQFEREMYASQMTSDDKMQEVEEHSQFISALKKASGIWMTASYFNHSCLGLFFFFYAFFIVIIHGQRACLGY